MGWTSPFVLSLICGGLAVLAIFCVIETRVAEPMFRLALFRIRPFTAGNLASLLSSLGRGGLIFILIIWLQGIYLPIHGYSFSDTPLWAGIALLGYNPIRTLLGPALSKLPANHAAYLTGHSFFPSLISGPFSSGLRIAFDFAIAACLIAALASLLRGKKYVHDDLHGVPATRDEADARLKTGSRDEADARLEAGELAELESFTG
ncbi:MAG: hypothetical protein ACRDPY_01890 [Streptosporangiaceae bacterium]